jgi:DNA-binding MarR family transcriptional regulator
MQKHSWSIIPHQVEGRWRLSKTEQQILEYIRKSKDSREPVWLSEAIEELRLDLKEAVRSAKALEELGLVAPKRNGHR